MIKTTIFAMLIASTANAKTEKKSKKLAAPASTQLEIQAPTRKTFTKRAKELYAAVKGALPGAVADAVLTDLPVSALMSLDEAARTYNYNRNLNDDQKISQPTFTGKASALSSGIAWTVFKNLVKGTCRRHLFAGKAQPLCGIIAGTTIGALGNYNSSPTDIGMAMAEESLPPTAYIMASERLGKSIKNKDFIGITGVVFPISMLSAAAKAITKSKTKDDKAPSSEAVQTLKAASLITAAIAVTSPYNSAVEGWLAARIQQAEDAITSLFPAKKETSAAPAA